MSIYITFPEGKTKALTMSYDDGKQSDRRLLAIFNRYGIKGTFNLNAGLMDQPVRIDRSEIKDLYRGHEIATHTYTHPTIARCPNVEIIREIVRDRQDLESITGTPVRGHAYPNGSVNEEVRQIFKSAGIVYGRPVETTGTFDLPEDWMYWRPTCHHRDHLLARGEEFLNFQKRQYLKCMFVWGHSYEFDDDGNWDLIGQFCEMMGGRPDIWYAANIEIHDYMEAAKDLQFAADESFVYNPDAMDLWLDVDGSIVKVPGGKQVNL